MNRQDAINNAALQAVEELNTAATGDRIGAIKRIRKLTVSTGLREAKDAVDAVLNGTLTDRTVDSDGVVFTEYEQVVILSALGDLANCSDSAVERKIAREIISKFG